MRPIRRGGPSPAPPKREVPFDEKSNVGLLVEAMAGSWGSRPPPQTAMAEKAIDILGLLSLRRQSSMLYRSLLGRRLTDLGAGDPVMMLHFALEYGASEYVAVEAYRDYSGNGLVGVREARLINADMLEYLAFQKDASTNIVMNAINEEVLRGPSRLITDAYLEYLARNIARVVPPGGAAFGVMSPVLGELERFGFERIRRTDASHLGEFEFLLVRPE